MEDFIIYLAKSAGLLTAFLVFYSLLLKKDTSFITNRKFLLAGLVTSALLPAIYFTKTVIIKAQASQFQFTEAAFPVTEVAIQEPIVSLIEIVAGIYILGVSIMILRLFMQLFSLTKILLSGNFSKQENVSFIETARQIAPFSFLNYVVYNPSLHSKTELEYILKHEKAHVTQRHTFDVLLANLNLIYQWFNPFAWLYLKSIQQNLEFIADREAVKKAACKKEYQKALVKISVENFNLALTNNFYQSLIKKRIIMLNKSASGKSTSWKAVLIAPALLAFVFLFNIKTVAQIQTEEQEKISKEEVITEYEISFQVENTTKQEQLEAYIRLLEKYKVQLEFQNVTRNDAGLITGISANYLDKNNNNSGSINRQNEDGIKGFEVYYSQKDGAGFRTPSDKQGGDSHAIVRNLEMEPLVIIEGKQYSNPQLEGKAIRILGDVGSINSVKAVITYGNAAKDGALIISKGEIIEDMKAELREIDKQDDKVTRDYIQFEKGKKPMFISLNKQESLASTKVEVSNRVNSGSNQAITIKNLKTNGKDPIYVLNGRVLGSNAMVDTIDLGTVREINVLKGKEATSVYGNKAKDGAIIISTMKSGDTTGFKFNTGTLILKDSATAKNVTYSASKVKFVDLDSLSPSRRKFVLSNAKAIYYDAPLYIVDGRKMDSKFEISSLDNSTIKLISVIKGAEAVDKYGEEAKGGAVEITIKKNTTVDMGTMAIISPNSTQSNLQEFQRKLKAEGIHTVFEKVKRNKEGVITNIKIIAKHKNREMSATFSETGGIPKIFVGLINGELVVSSNPPGMN